MVDMTVVRVCDTLQGNMLYSRAGRTYQILQEFVFSPEITCNCKMTRVRRRSVSKRILLVCDPKRVWGRFGGARRMKMNVSNDIYSDEG